MVQEKKAAHFVRLRGLPYSAQEAEIREFFDEIPVVEVQFTYTSDGRASGECYVEFDNPEDVVKALKKHNSNMGSRYIEVFTVGEIEFEGIMRRAEVKKQTGNVGFVRCRGLPYGCTKEDLLGFFKDINVEEVIFGKEPWAGGRPSGEAFIRFATKADADKAMELNGKHMGSRYLELFRIDGDAFDAFRKKMNNEPIPLKHLDLYSDPRTNYKTPGYGGGPGGYGGYDRYGYGAGPYGGPPHREDPWGYGPARGGRGDYGPPSRYSPYGGGYGGPGGYGAPGGYGGPPGGGYVDPDHEPLPTRVQMRGIPFSVTAKDIEEFFKPLTPIDIRLGYYENGRSTGDGYVEFASIDEAKQALRKDRQNIGSRYVELFAGSAMRLFPDASYVSIGQPAKPFASDAVAAYGGYGYGGAAAAPGAPGYGTPGAYGGAGRQPAGQPAPGANYTDFSSNATPIGSGREGTKPGGPGGAPGGYGAPGGGYAGAGGYGGYPGW